MKRLLLAITLACALSAPALAGEVPTTGAPAPAPTSSASEGSSPAVISIILAILGAI